MLRKNTKTQQVILRQHEEWATAGRTETGANSETAFETLDPLCGTVGKQKIPSGGHDEGRESVHGGNYLQQQTFLAEYNPDLYSVCPLPKCLLKHQVLKNL